MKGSQRAGEPAGEPKLEEPVRYLVLACDYDGTLATSGRVDDAFAVLHSPGGNGPHVLVDDESILADE